MPKDEMGLVAQLGPQPRHGFILDRARGALKIGIDHDADGMLTLAPDVIAVSNFHRRKGGTLIEQGIQDKQSQHGCNTKQGNLGSKCFGLCFFLCGLLLLLFDFSLLFSFVHDFTLVDVNGC